MTEDVLAPGLDDRSFARIAALALKVAGISLNRNKATLVQTRLTSRLRVLGVRSFEAYADMVEQPGQPELVLMIEALTTNKTSFFREDHHFDYLARWLHDEHHGPALRGWSAGCSTGEEPYTLAMVMHEALPNVSRRDVRILATDINARVLDRARAGTYDAEAIKAVPDQLASRWFSLRDDRRYQVDARLQKMVAFARLNLMDPWPMKGRFDFIFCRNVMIYFDRPTRESLCQRFGDLLVPGGHLFLGHAESLMSATGSLTYVQPAVYRKCS